MGPSNISFNSISFLSFRVIFRFHDSGRSGRTSISTSESLELKDIPVFKSVDLRIAGHFEDHPS